MSDLGVTVGQQSCVCVWTHKAQSSAIAALAAPLSRFGHYLPFASDRYRVPRLRSGLSAKVERSEGSTPTK